MIMKSVLQLDLQRAAKHFTNVQAPIIIWWLVVDHDFWHIEFIQDFAKPTTSTNNPNNFNQQPQQLQPTTPTTSTNNPNNFNQQPQQLQPTTPTTSTNNPNNFNQQPQQLQPTTPTTSTNNPNNFNQQLSIRFDLRYNFSGASEKNSRSSQGDLNFQVIFGGFPADELQCVHLDTWHLLSVHST